MKNLIILHKFILNILALFIIAVPTFAAPVVRKLTATSGEFLDGVVVQFKKDLVGNTSAGNNGTGGAYSNGFRQIDWEDAPGIGQGNYLPGNYYNKKIPRGIIMTNTCTHDEFITSNSFNSGFPTRFSDLNPTYAASFKTYIGGGRLFSSVLGGCNTIDVYFFVPGTNTPATVNGFGAFFTDVDFFAVKIDYFGTGGQLISSQDVDPMNNGISFLGTSFDGGERIAHVRIYSGTANLGESDGGSTGVQDIVVMDDFIYGEPHALGHHANDFDGDGAADFTVYRPSAGAWYTLNSGSNTVNISNFGQSGDVPVDGDFDGDGRADIALYRPTNGVWYRLNSSDGKFVADAFGQDGDNPVTGDYDRDGRTDLALFRLSTSSYYILQSSNKTFRAVPWGQGGDIPIGASQP